MRALPKVVYVSIREPGESGWMTCETNKVEAIEDDGPTLVGTYRLDYVEEVHKEAVGTKRRGKKHGTKSRQK